MDESDGVAAAVIQTPRRNVRRKLVQSTLLPHRSEDLIGSNGDRTCDDVGEREEGGEGGFCCSQGKTTRKQRTPKTNGASKKDAIESTGDRTCDDGGEKEEGDGGFCSSQGKKTRKQRTPKKNGASNKVRLLLFLFFSDKKNELSCSNV